MGYLETYRNLVLGGMDPDEAAVEAAELENMYGDSEDDIVHDGPVGPMRLNY